ncbi:MAG: YihY/virulence factor BrkB family protein [Elusimicrobiota bacterium]|nr:MAG: YihY/virulence factor BrkB family protein [Elusimicrobiota bacterium]
MKYLSSSMALVKTAARGISEDKVPMMGAALAYYTAFSIAPMLVIAIGIAGIVFGDGGGTHVFETIRGLVGENGATAVQSMVEGAASRPKTGLMATVLGVITMLVGASGVFGQMQESLNVIWKTAPRPDAGWGATIKRRLLSFGMIGVIAFLLMVSLVVSAGLAAAGKFAAGLPGGEAVWQAVNVVVSLGVISALFALIFKVLPDVRLPWRTALLGGFWTSLLFTAGKMGIGLYLGKSGVASTYGAAGSVIVLLLWVYYSSQIVLFGAELTRAYAERDGRRLPLKEGAVALVTPFNATAQAQKQVRDGEPDPHALWYVVAAAGMLGGAALLKKGRSEKWRRPVLRGVLGGLSTGAGAAMAAMLEAKRRIPGVPVKLHR